ncbi:MAG TPA: T9SS type A sorting domain-containing protein, partial [Flavobacterium sp.]|nr:T9SS type A sorting domain-containing protein [Flavobacterium sp.]
SVKEISAGIFSVTVSLMADATITATVTDRNGCTATTSKDIHAEDVRCFAGNSGNAKVTICHRTGSAKNPCVAICVDQSAVQEHLNHGDYVGTCNKACVAPVNTKLIEVVEEETIPFNVIAYPNPSRSQFTLQIEGGQNEKVEVLVYDMLARLIKRIEKSDGQPILFGEELPTGEYLTIVKQGENMKAVNLIKQ